MIQISKDEAEAMRKICGNRALQHTWNKRYRHYFLVENPRNIKALEEYRKQRTIKTVTPETFLKQE